MNFQSIIQESFARNTGLITRECAGISHDTSLTQTPYNVNCMNWVLGHIVTFRDVILKQLGQAPLFAAHAARYGRESTAITQDGADVVNFAMLLETATQQQNAIAEALKHKSDADIQAEIEMFQNKRTVEYAIMFSYFHETFHIGELSVLRQLSGKSDKII